MKYFCSFSTYFFLLLNLVILTNQESLVPAVFLFGDSLVDIGNNNNRSIIMKTNYPPYGRDFENHVPTGRSSNGELIPDYIVDFLGFTTYPPAYLNLETKGKNIVQGANFASIGSGYLDCTSKIDNVIPLSRQLEYYKECQSELIKTVGQSNALSIIAGGIHGVLTGNNDFLLNYFLHPSLWISYTPDQFSDLPIQNYYKFIQELHLLGAKKIVVFTMSSIGCVPIAITLFGSHGNNGCVDTMNDIAINFNKKLVSVSQNLRKTYPDLNLVLLDGYKPLYDLVSTPSEYGFFETRKACCGTGLVEVSILCNEKSLGTCANASQYVFWDSAHPSDAANKLLAERLISPIISLLS